MHNTLKVALDLTSRFAVNVRQTCPCEFDVSTRYWKFQLKVSDNSINFPMNLQNSNFRNSASLAMVETQKDHWGLILKNWSDWNFKNVTEVPFGKWNINLKFQRYNFQHQSETSNLEEHV